MRTIQKLLLAIAALALPLSGCTTSNPKEPCITHVDSDHDGKCDNCGETMPKENLDFVGLSFENKTFTYDGEEHSIYVEGVPEFAEVEYTNNGQIELGTYNVKAKVSAAGYNTKTLTAKLTIKGKEFTGITFKDKEFMQDGYYHYIYVEGAPDFASVTYSNNNGQKTAGTYVITATITAPHYEKLVLTAKLIISNKLPDADIVDRTLIYNGSDQRIVHSIPELPRNTEITYKVDGTTVSEENFCVKTVGDHVASIIISSTDGSRSSSTVNANITVIENNIGGVDSSKTPLKIDENLKYQTLRSKILEGNFTIKKEYFDDYYDPNSKELLESNLDSTTYFYVDGNETFEHFFYTEYSQLLGSQSNYRHTKLKDGEVRSALFEDGILDASYYDSSYIMDGSCYQENVVARTGLKAMAILNEAEDGGFENSSEGNYATEFGSFKIDSENNCFVHDVVARYYHSPNPDHDEHTRYTIYNIGNTTVNVPKVFDAFEVDAEFEELNSYYIDGFKYTFSENQVTLDPILNAVSVTYLPKGTYTLPAMVNGLPVTKLSTGYYSPQYNNDCSGYTFKVYFDSYGDYQGPYEELGYISGFRNIYELMYDDANVLFYGEW